MDMSEINNQQASLDWSKIYAQLSEFFKEPSAAFAEDVASGRLARFFDVQFRFLDLDPAPCSGLALDGNVMVKLADEYKRLFRGPLPPYVVPVESVYKKWASDPGCDLPLAQEKGFLMGDPAVDMIRRYREEGIAIPDELSSMPDHIALELEYMSLLSAGADEGACKEFLNEHLDWLDDLACEIEAVGGGGGVYSNGARIACAIVNLARGTSPPQAREGTGYVNRELEK